MKRTKASHNPKQSSVKVIGMKKDERGNPLTIMEITIDGVKHVVVTHTTPQCFGKWNEWTSKVGWTNCKNCIFRDLCREVTLRKIVAKYEMEKHDEEAKKKRYFYQVP